MFLHPSHVFYAEDANKTFENVETILRNYPNVHTCILLHCETDE